MKTVRGTWPGILLCLVLAGCGSQEGSDSDPPPGVTKNDHPNTDGATGKKGKPFLAGGDPKRP